MSTDNPRTPESGPHSTEPSGDSTQPVAPVIPTAPIIPTAPVVPSSPSVPAPGGDNVPPSPQLPVGSALPPAQGLSAPGYPAAPGTPVAPIVPGSVGPGGQSGQFGAPAPQTNVVAIVGLALAVAGFFSAFFPGTLAIGILLLIPAFVLGIIGLLLPNRPRLLAAIAVAVSLIGGITGVITTAFWFTQTVTDALDVPAEYGSDGNNPLLPGDDYDYDYEDDAGTNEFGADGTDDYPDVPSTYPVDLYAMPGIIGEFGYGEIITFSSGISVELTAPTPYEPTDAAVGEDGGENLRVEITVTNTSDEDFDPYMMSVLGVSEGYSVSEIYDDTIDSYLIDIVPAGQSITYSAAYSVADLDDLVFEVVPDVSDTERALVR
ncbi:MAG: hypothetical protein ACTJHU_04540 [Mycetocola sp.]